jgi:hypothetical protein
MRIVLTSVIAAVIFGVATQSLGAQNIPAKVCIVQTSGSDASTGEALRFADAVSQQKLLSGRPITGFSLLAKSKKELASQIQTNGCDYLVRLQPFVDTEGGMNAANDAMGSPSAAGPAYHPGLDDPVLTYELWKIGQKHSLARGAAIYQYTGGRHNLLAPDCGAFAARVVRQIGQ